MTEDGRDSAANHFWPSNRSFGAKSFKNNGQAIKLIANISTCVSLDDPTPTATCPLHHTVAMTLIKLDSEQCGEDRY